MQHTHSVIQPQATRPAQATTHVHSDIQYRTTDRVLQILLRGDLSRLRVDSVATQLGMSATTLRRRLRLDHTHYQFLLDRARQYRCEQALQAAWRPGKCLADELGYLEVNSFYRAFRRWTGVGFSAWKVQRY